MRLVQSVEFFSLYLLSCDIFLVLALPNLVNRLGLSFLLNFSAGIFAVEFEVAEVLCLMLSKDFRNLSSLVLGITWSTWQDNVF